MYTLMYIVMIRCPINILAESFKNLVIIIARPHLVTIVFTFRTKMNSRRQIIIVTTFSAFLALMAGMTSGIQLKIDISAHG